MGIYYNICRQVIYKLMHYSTKHMMIKLFTKPSSELSGLIWIGRVMKKEIMPEKGLKDSGEPCRPEWEGHSREQHVQNIQNMAMRQHGVFGKIEAVWFIKRRKYKKSSVQK